MREGLFSDVKLNWGQMASGFIESWVVHLLLDYSYYVHATIHDPAKLEGGLICGESHGTLRKLYDCFLELQRFTYW